MNLFKWRTLPLLMFAALGLTSCGVDEFLAAIQVLPQNAMATVGSPTATVQFTAIGWYAPLQSCGYSDCGLDKPNKRVTLTNASWSTSDPADTTIDSQGGVICLAPSLSPVTITATASGGQFGPIRGTAELICK